MTTLYDTHTLVLELYLSARLVADFQPYTLPYTRGHAVHER